MAICSTDLEVTAMQYASPLRYPGGKRKLAEFVGDVVIQNGIQGGTYIEPFAGGASVALYLLFNEYVNQVVINDLDRSIYAFWYCALNRTEELCTRIRNAEITIEEWKRQRGVQGGKDNVDLVDLAFSTFFLNRTNRSGIIKGGVIGGQGQAGEWKMDVRFNKRDLIRRIEKISLYRGRIGVYNKDALDFVGSMLPMIDEHTLIYFDPPYYNQGSGLYVNHYSHQDHKTLSLFIQNLTCKWILTYDHAPQIIEMYKDARKKSLTLSYTACRKAKGSEMLAYSRNCAIPDRMYSAISIE